MCSNNATNRRRSFKCRFSGVIEKTWSRAPKRKAFAANKDLIKGLKWASFQVKISEFVLRAYKADDDVGELDSLA
ncbi:hypothetical protein Tco_1098419 [Tanacetum coccineum]